MFEGIFKSKESPEAQEARHAQNRAIMADLEARRAELAKTAGDPTRGIDREESARLALLIKKLKQGLPEYKKPEENNTVPESEGSEEEAA